MKKLVLLTLILLSVSITAQQRRNRNNPFPNTNNRSASIPEFKAAEAAGLIHYDIKKTCKKIGVKQKSDAGKKVVNRLTKHNKSVKDAVRINSFSLKDLEKNYKAAYKTAQETKDFSSIMALRKQIKVVLDPIRKVASKNDSILNVDLKGLLNKKQFKKWEKYNKNIKKRTGPKVRRQPARTMRSRRGF
ncbi:hypothetical protein RQM59_03225 [Flavobacteriaceae bacterium S356]|uniref:Uncharacterized protein n=1 Tax=Asprobacillus argus TaxID=3076534 RepID=A0ABU3LCC0_9FLAO|nr:hypothetical protein [Flavobacteriaceae bacterium S356]